MKFNHFRVSIGSPVQVRLRPIIQGSNTHSPDDVCVRMSCHPGLKGGPHVVMNAVMTVVQGLHESGVNYFILCTSVNYWHECRPFEPRMGLTRMGIG
jgi:hypothetical protein